VDLTLILVTPEGRQQEVPVRKPRQIVGRNTDCAIRIPVSSVSRQHCEITLDDHKAVIKDLGSSNGTYVNRAMVAEHTLASGDHICIGPAVFVVRIDGRPAQIDSQQALERGLVAAAMGVRPVDPPKPVGKPAIKPAGAAGKPASKKSMENSGSDLGLKPLTSDDSSVDFDFSDDDDAPKL
jgi:predicted component of type VI protein secretion system